GAGDVNGDGNADLIWVNKSTSQFGYWMMNGSKVLSLQTFGVAPGYSIATLGDFNGDGKVDILWTDATMSNVYMWTSQGSWFSSQKQTMTVSPGFSFYSVTTQ
ncbi:MAG: VCBS repeat-containing protein, partial [Dyella sp.]|nr:VCBS repeat-containing protein [Dyella sp.]